MNFKKVKVTLASNPLAVETVSSYTATVEAVDTDSLSGKRDVIFKVMQIKRLRMKDKKSGMNLSNQ